MCATRVVCRWQSAYCKVDFVKHIYMWTQKAWLPSLDNITQSQNDSCQSNHQFGKVPSLSVSDFFLWGWPAVSELYWPWLLADLLNLHWLGALSQKIIKSPKHETHLCWWLLDRPPSMTADPLVAYVFSFWIDRAVCDCKDFSTLLVWINSLLRKFSDYLNLTYEKTKREDTKKRPEQRDGQAGQHVTGQTW